MSRSDRELNTEFAFNTFMTVLFKNKGDTLHPYLNSAEYKTSVKPIIKIRSLFSEQLVLSVVVFQKSVHSDTMHCNGLHYLVDYCISTQTLTLTMPQCGECHFTKWKLIFLMFQTFQPFRKLSVCCYFGS